MNKANNKCPIRKKIADETLEIVSDGFYYNQSGQKVDLEVQPCLDKTGLYSPKGLRALLGSLAFPPKFASTAIHVVNETTLTGAERAEVDYCIGRPVRVGVLNFASAKNPGGGFLRGAQAQEESLARSSALYSSLKQCPNFYYQDSPLYSDQIILSPLCPVFRRDDGTLLDSPYYVNFITCPAPNAGTRKVLDPKLLRDTFERRISYVLTLAVTAACDVVILGAWGCGVFKNDPRMVAEVFRDCLHSFEGRFSNVVFSVIGDKTYTTFAELLGDKS